jgi:hypothetical protein
VDAFDELALRGEIGASTYALLLSRTRSEVHRRGYPSPGPGGAWTEDDYADIVHELASKKPSLTLDLLSAADQNALTALVTTIVRNFLIDQVKASDVGRVSGRLDTLMRKDPRFAVDSDDRWSLAAGPQTRSNAGRYELEAAAWNPRGLHLGVLPSAGPTPAAECTTLLTVVEAVLAAAGGSVERLVLARAVGRRFGLVAQIRVELPEAHSPQDQDMRVGQPSREVLAALDDQERAAVHARAREGTIAAVAAALHCGRRQAAAILQRALDKIRSVVDAEGIDDHDLLATIDRLAPPRARPHPDRSSSTDVHPTHPADPDRTRR